MLHHLAAHNPQVTGFFQYLQTLQHVHNTCGIVYTPDDSTAPNQIVYGGGCLQSFTIALQSHNPNWLFVWDILGG